MTRLIPAFILRKTLHSTDRLDFLLLVRRLDSLGAVGLGGLDLVLDLLENLHALSVEFFGLVIWDVRGVESFHGVVDGLRDCSLGCFDHLVLGVFGGGDDELLGGLRDRGIASGGGFGDSESEFLLEQVLRRDEIELVGIVGVDKELSVEDVEEEGVPLSFGGLNPGDSFTSGDFVFDGGAEELGFRSLVEVLDGAVGSCEGSGAGDRGVGCAVGVKACRHVVDGSGCVERAC